MTIRKLLLILFLYILLVWIIAAYLFAYSGPGEPGALTRFGLLWTAIGVGALLFFVLVERLFSWWRARREKAAATPAPAAAGPAAGPASGPKVMTEDEATLLSLMREADQRLAQAPGISGIGSVLELPLFLAVGLEHSGKTALIHYSGVEPSLLAGQVLGATGGIAPTKVANLWLVHQSLFLEVSGRIFSGERLGEFLSILQPPRQTGWKSWFAAERRPVALKGVLLFFDAREFMGTPDVSKLDRFATTLRARLRTAATVFGAEFPVYTLFTNTEALPYFEEFFNGLAEIEAGQALGVITESPETQIQGRVWAEAETKRLNQHLQSLFLRLSDRRLIALTQETEPLRKPAIYEFPREFKRIRTPLVQFLIDVFKPDPLGAGPRLRGIFFTGTRKVEETAVSAAETLNIYRPQSTAAAPDATQIFALGAGLTSVFKVKSKSGSGRLVDRWIFANEFFQNVLRLDRPAVRAVARPSRFGKNRQVALAVGAGLAVILALIWTVSWVGNWGLESDLETLVRNVRAGNNDLSMANLQALDKLRGQLEQMEQDNPMHLHWGLYTGDDLKDLASRVYFSRLKQLSLDRIDQTLNSQLRRVGNSTDDSGLTYTRLKTIRTIAARACDVDQPVVSRVLTATVPEAHLGLGDGQRALLGKQLDFYVMRLAADKKLPLALAEDPTAVDTARAFVRRTNGDDQRLAGLVSEINGTIKLPVPPEFREVLTGQTEVAGAFTKRGQLLFEDQIAQGKFGSEERCVMGDSMGQQLAHQVVDSGTADRLRSLYYRRYADAWRDFLGSYKVKPWTTLDDAVMKLDKLSASTSPLLGIVRMTAENTDFPPPKPGELTAWEKTAQKLGLGGGVSQAQAAADKARGAVTQILTGQDAVLMTPADVGALFQPVMVTALSSGPLVNDKNRDYVNGLRQLKEKVDLYSNATGASKSDALNAANLALTQALDAHAKLSDTFDDAGKQGLNRVLSALLKQPLDLARASIPANPTKDLISGKNGDLRKFCSDMAPTLARYPFNPDAKSVSDASLSDVDKAFAPGKGMVWNYVQKSAAELVVLNAKDQVYEQNPMLQGAKVSSELLRFLNRSNDLQRIFFGPGGMKLTFTLRRPQGQKIGVHLILDGQDFAAQEPYQKVFTWPGAVAGAEGYVVEDGGRPYPFGSFNDLWAVFRLFQGADDRPASHSPVTWSTVTGQGGALPQKLPVPGSIDVVAFPGGVDVFNKQFFRELQCPKQAVTPN